MRGEAESYLASLTKGFGLISFTDYFVGDDVRLSKTVGIV
jgi:hypothetical protein